MNYKISVVMPTFHVEDYIADSIKSLCNQNFKDFEVVLVNDGSTDKSIEIAEEILKDTTIDYRVIHRENGGVSKARNAGINAAKGQWVICIDPDDVLAPDFLMALNKVTEEKEDAQIVIGNFKKVDMTNIHEYSNWDNQYKEIPKEEILKQYLQREILVISPGMLIKKDFIEEKKLKYKEDCTFSEDMEYIWRALFACEKVYYIDCPMYNYLTRPNSTMTASKSHKIVTGYSAMVRLHMELVNFDGHEYVKKYILSRWVMGALNTVARISSYEDFKAMCDTMNYKDNSKTLLSFPSTKVKILALSLLLSRRSYFKLVNSMK